MSKKPVWRTGAPPSLGWWPASVYGTRDPEYLGWYDGKYWSAFCHVSHSDAYAAAQAEILGGSQDVEWTDRPDSWPARSKT